MTALVEAKNKDVDQNILEALQGALSKGALPGESEGLDQAALAAAGAFLGPVSRQSSSKPWAKVRPAGS